MKRLIWVCALLILAGTASARADDIQCDPLFNNLNFIGCEKGVKTISVQGEQKEIRYCVKQMKFKPKSCSFVVEEELPGYDIGNTAVYVTAPEADADKIEFGTTRKSTWMTSKTQSDSGIYDNASPKFLVEPTPELYQDGARNDKGIAMLREGGRKISSTLSFYIKLDTLHPDPAPWVARTTFWKTGGNTAVLDISATIPSGTGKAVKAAATSATDKADGGKVGGKLKKLFK